MAIQNLRDKLLKAGLVDKKQKQQADTQDRRDKKQKGHDKLAEEEAERQRLFAEKAAKEAEEQRQRELEQAAQREQRERENRVRNICDRWAVRQLKPGQRKFYFVQRTGRIAYLLVNDGTYDQLLVGALAVVDRLAEADTRPAVEVLATVKPKRRSALDMAGLGRDKQARPAGKSASLATSSRTVETHVLLPPEPAERVLELEPAAVRFWARKGQSLGFVSDGADAMESIARGGAALGPG